MANLQGTDLYTRFMVKAFKEQSVIATPKGFQAFFDNPGISNTVFENDASVVEIDIERANGEKLAATVHRGKSSLPVDKANAQVSKYTNFSRLYPLVEEVGHINSAKLLDRLAGEAAFNSGLTQFDRARAKAQDLHIDSVKKIIRTMEFFAAQSILTGVQPGIIGTTNADLQYDFHRLATHIFTPAVKWDAATPVIMSDIDASCALIEEDANMEANFMGLGEGATDAFIKDTTVAALADNRRYELIEVSTNNPVPPSYDRFVKAGWIPRGRLRTPGGRVLWMFNYNKNYTPLGGGSKTRFLPTDSVIIADINARCDRYFGPKDRLPVTPVENQWIMQMFGIDAMAPSLPQEIDTAGIILPQMFHFDAYADNDKKTAVLRSQAAPIFPTVQTDAFVTMTSVLT